MLDLTDVSDEPVRKTPELFVAWDSFTIQAGTLNSVMYSVLKGEDSVILSGNNQLSIRIEKSSEHTFRFSIGHLHSTGTSSVWVKHNPQWKPKPKKVKQQPLGAVTSEVGEEEW
jgi:hypothetical protein